jgi:mthZ
MTHRFYFQPAQSMVNLDDQSIDLVVTSPPYPMIEMWDSILGQQNAEITTALAEKQPKKAFELMHQVLDLVWSECFRVLKEGSFLCINIGDATRTIDGEFAVYNNSMRITQACETLGFTTLPCILWRKPTNAPNKFMGSGMLPCGAYVTLEHEWILIFRKGGKKKYTTTRSKANRRESSFFWEERNLWFSDLWELRGTKQKIQSPISRTRNASYPTEIPYRLMNMFSERGDTILDPFAGLGTTTIAAILSERNSVGIEIDPLLKPAIQETVTSLSVSTANMLIHERYLQHIHFIEERIGQGKEVKYYNDRINCPVMTSQETDLTLHYIDKIHIEDSNTMGLEITASYLEKQPIADLPINQEGTLFP